MLEHTFGMGTAYWANYRSVHSLPEAKRLHHYDPRTAKDKMTEPKRIRGGGILKVGAVGGPISPAPTVDGKPCPCAPLTSPRARRFAGLMLVKSDLAHVASFLTPLSEDLDDHDPETHTIAQSLLLSAIVTYGKCFVSSTGRKVVLGSKHLAGLSDAERKIHREMLEMRHEFVAHAGTSSNEGSHVFAVLDPGNAKQVLGLGAFTVVMARKPPAKIREWLKVVEKVRLNVEAEEKAASEALDAEVRAAPVETWYKRAIKPAFPAGTEIVEFPSDAAHIIEE